MSNKDRIVFSINGARSIGHPYRKKKGILTPAHNICKSQFWVDWKLNVKNEPVKLVENKTGEYLHDLEVGKAPDTSVHTQRVPEGVSGLALQMRAAMQGAAVPSVISLCV